MTSPWWRGDLFASKIPYLQARAQVARDIRAFFDARGFLEVETPALQTAPCMEAHIQAFRTEIVSPDLSTRRALYLHTSPEFAMKKLLVAGLPRIYQLAKVFRNAEGSSWHSPEFTMLEWYQAGLSYEDMMSQTQDLVRTVAQGRRLRAGDRSCDPAQPWERITVVEALRRHAGVEIEGRFGDLAHLRAEAARIGVHVPDSDDWENALLKILMDKVEPRLGNGTVTILCDYPVSMAALSRPKPSAPHLAERFEVYACGIELANAFGELTDAKAQRARFEAEVALRKKTYGDDYPIDEDFIAAIEAGLPESSGNALGFDRLVMLLTGASHISLVQAAPV